MRRGPDEWRCHGITHFRHRVLEPEFDAAVRLLLQTSKVRVDEAGWTALHETADRTIVYTSSLLLKTARTPLNPNTPYERTVVDVHWDLIHLPDLAQYDALNSNAHDRSPPLAAHRGPALALATFLLSCLRDLLAALGLA